jgi:hypothetical protein
MGSTCSGNLVAENAPGAARLEWLPANKVQTITADGTYDISAMEIAPGSAAYPQLLKIKTSTHGFYYLSYRKARSDISVPPNTQIPSVFFDGVSVHADELGFTNHLGDPLGPDATVNRLIGVLEDGKSFVDSQASVTVTQVSHGANSAQVTIDIVTCP